MTTYNWTIAQLDCYPEYEANIDKEIADQANPPVVNPPLPWN